MRKVVVTIAPTTWTLGLAGVVVAAGVGVVAAAMTSALAQEDE